MEPLSTKIKLILLLIACCSLLMAVYWAYVKQRKPHLTASKSHFSVPKDKITKRVLPNGMHVLMYKNDSLPKVLVQIAYDIGSFVEESGERGLAHLVEHMIFKGTDKLSETDIDTIARKYGATYNAYTSMDVTSYYFEANKNNWKPFLEILADCMQNVRFDEQHLASEVKAVIQELKMNKDNYWKVLCLKALELTFPPHHPYHTMPIGFKEDLLNLNAERIKAFYKKYYRPDHATLFVVGDINPDEVMAEVEKTFGTITAERLPLVKEFPTVTTELLTHHTRFYEDVKTEHVALYWLIPGLKHEQEQIATALEAVLGAGRGGLLDRALIDEQKVAASVSAYALKLMESGVFFIMLEPLPGKKEACIHTVREVLDRLVRKGVTDAELARVAKIKTVSFFNKMLDYQELVSAWLQSYFATRDELHLFNRVNRFHDVTSTDLQNFVAAYMDPFLMHQAELLPLPDNKQALRERMKQESDALDQRILSKHVRTAPVEGPKAASQYEHPAPLSFDFPKPVHTFTLPNGLAVTLTQQHHMPMVSAVCSFKDASYFNEAREGLPLDLMMNMLIEGSKGRTKKDNVDFFEQRGAGYSFESRGASVASLASDFVEVVERFVEVLCNPTFPKDALEKTKKITVDNYERCKDSPKDVAFRTLKNALYKGHPFAWTFDEAITDISSATTTSMRELHDKLVTAENMMLSIVGDFDVQEMEHIVRRYFGQLQPGVRVGVVQDRPAKHDAQQIDIPMTRDQVVLVYGRQANVTVYDPDYVPLKLLTSICFRSLGSRIFKVRERTGLFYTAFGEFDARAAKMPGYDYLGMIISPENIAVAEKEVHAFLDEIAKNGVTAGELDAAKNMYEKDLIDLLGNNTQIGRLVNNLQSLDLPYDYYDKVLQRIHAITVDEMNALAARYASKEGFVRICVGRVGSAGSGKSQ